MTKEKLVQDILDKGDRAKNLNHLIEIMERKKIAYFTEIVCWLLDIFEERQSVEFTPETLRYLHQEIIEGHQEGNSSPLVFMVQKLVVVMRTVAFWLGQLPGPLDMYTVDSQHITWMFNDQLFANIFSAVNIFIRIFVTKFLACPSCIVQLC